MEQKRLERITNVVQKRQSGIIVVLENIHDPHNAAAIMRTCDAFGIQTVWFIFDQELPYNPKRVGKASSSSANKWLDFKTFNSTLSCFKTLKQENYISIATAFTPTAKKLNETEFDQKKIAIWVGNEHAGLSKEAIENADQTIIIPMNGFVQSLNVSVATAVVLWEVVKQRNTFLSSQDQKILLDNFLKK
jgi:tRNA (guanosine-2'-O-)-methyltransferase